VWTVCGVSVTLQHQTMCLLLCRVLVQFLNDAAYVSVNCDNSCTVLMGFFFFFLGGMGISMKTNNVI
jgi:hypothetical protein